MDNNTFNILVYEDQPDVAGPWLKILNDQKNEIKNILNLEEKVNIYIEHVDRIEKIQRVLSSKKFDIIFSDTMEKTEFSRNYKTLRKRSDIIGVGNERYKNTPIILVGSNRRSDGNTDEKLFQDKTVSEPVPVDSLKLENESPTTRVYVYKNISDESERKIIVNTRYGELKGNFTMKELRDHKDEIKNLLGR